MDRYRITVRTNLRSYRGLIGIVNPKDQAQVQQAAVSVVGGRGLQPGDRILVYSEKGGRPVVPEVTV